MMKQNNHDIGKNKGTMEFGLGFAQSGTLCATGSLGYMASPTNHSNLHSYLQTIPTNTPHFTIHRTSHPNDPVASPIRTNQPTNQPTR